MEEKGLVRYGLPTRLEIPTFDRLQRFRFPLLGVGPDIWAKVRIDGKEGWVHTEEDLQAVGLYRR